jgi:glycosyltransferase involved in cell wall biosynthesis
MNIGGPAVQVAELVRGLNPIRFDQRLYTGFCESNEADYLDKVATDLKVYRIDGFGRRVSLYQDFRVLINLVREIRKFKPDIIHTHTFKAGFLGRIASIISSYPSSRVHTFHGHLLNGYFSPLKRSIIIILEKMLALYTDKLLAVGDQVRQDLLQEGIGTIENFKLMPPGLIIGPLTSKEEAQKSLGLSVGGLQCAFIGRVTQIKRPDRFLNVVSEVKRRGIKMNFFMAGDGEQLESCRKRISNESLPVNILGWQSDIEKVLSAADVIVLTSDNEGTPLSLIQGGMAGLAVVATNVGSIPEIVLNGTTGIITTTDVQDIANALERIFNDEDLRINLGVAAKKFTLSKFGVKRLLLDHEDLYEELVSSQAKT